MLVEVATVIRRHGFYPKPRHDIESCSPQLNVAHKYLVDRTRSENIANEFEKMRNALVKHPHGVFNSIVKRSVLGAKKLRSNSYDATTLTFFLLSYTAWLSETHLADIKTPILEIGNWFGSTKDADCPLDNLVMRRKPTDETTQKKVTNMKELCFSETTYPLNPSTHALNIYSVENGQQKKSRVVRRKNNLVATAKTTIGSKALMNFNDVVVVPEPKKKKRSTTVVAGGPEANEAAVPKNTAVVTTAANGTPMRRSKRKKTKGQHGTTTITDKLPSTPTMSPAEKASLALIEEFSPLLEALKDSQDETIKSQRSKAMETIVKYVAMLHGGKDDSIDSFTTATKVAKELSNEFGSEDGDSDHGKSEEEDTAPALTKEELMKLLESHREEHDPNGGMKVEAQMTPRQVMKAFGFEQHIPEVCVTGERYIDELVCIRFNRIKALWNSYNNKGKPPSDQITDFRRVIAVAKEGGWLASVEENKETPTGQFMVLITRKHHNYLKHYSPRTAQVGDKDTEPQLQSTATGGDERENILLPNQEISKEQQRTTSATCNAEGGDIQATFVENELSPGNATEQNSPAGKKRNITTVITTPDAKKKKTTPPPSRIKSPRIKLLKEKRAKEGREQY